MNSFTARVLVLSLALPAAAEPPSSKGVNFYSLDREAQLGQQQAADLARVLPVVHEANLDAYIAKLGSELAKHADQQFTYNFTVYEDRKSLAAQPVAMAMPADAFQGRATEPVALPGGPILVPLSLLAGAQDEAEFAFQLAHAMAHVALRHATRQATRAELVNMAAIRLEGMQIGFLKFARDFELQADTVAIGMLAATGYDPESVVRYLDHPAANTTQLSKVFSAHPTSAQRLEAVKAARQELPSHIYSSGTGEFEAMKIFAAGIR
jgi:predicted Zn-dependent protease